MASAARRQIIGGGAASTQYTF